MKTTPPPTKKEWTLSDLLYESGAVSKITQMYCSNCTNGRPDRWDFSLNPITVVREVGYAPVTCLECRKIYAFYQTLDAQVCELVHARLDNFLRFPDTTLRDQDKSDEPTRTEDPDARLRRLRDNELARVFG